MGDTHHGSGLVFKNFCLTKNGGDFEFSKFLQNTKMLEGANSTKFLTCWISLQSSHANFQNIFVSPNIAAILNFLQKLQNTKILYLENRAR